MDVWSTLNFTVWALRIIVMLVVIIATYSSYQLYTDINEAISMVKDFQTDSIVIKNRSPLPLDIDIAIEMYIKNEKVGLVKKRINIPPGESRKVSVKPEEIFSSLHSSILLEALFNPLDVDIHLKVTSRLGYIASLNASTTKRIRIGPLIESLEIRHLDLERINSTHRRIGVWVKVFAPLLSNKEVKFRLILNNMVSPWYVGAFDVNGVLLIEHVFTISSGPLKEEQLEICMGNTCLKKTLEV